MHTPSPGISRNNRISDEGLQRLENQLKTGRRPSQPVLAQWVKRHGQAAQKIIDENTPSNKGNIES